MPTFPPCLIEPTWEQFAALLPGQQPDRYPLDCHRPAYGQGSLREAHASPCLRLCLLVNRRQFMFGDHAAPSASRVDRYGDDGRSTEDSA